MIIAAGGISDGPAVGPVVGLLLASGFGRRFDAGGRRNKLLARLPDGRALVFASAHALCGALEQVAVVVPSRRTLIEAALLDLPVRLIRNPRAQDGMGASIAVGIAALRADFPEARGWLIALGDMPFIAPETIRAIADALPTMVDKHTGIAGHSGENTGQIVAASYRGRRGHPVAFARALDAQLTMLDGDTGAGQLLATHGVRLIECDDPGVLRDIDTRDDLSRAQLQTSSS